MGRLRREVYNDSSAACLIQFAYSLLKYSTPLIVFVMAGPSAVDSPPALERGKACLGWSANGRELGKMMGMHRDGDSVSPPIVTAALTDSHMVARTPII